MALNFPSNPATNDTYESGGRTWTFDGTSWAATGVGGGGGGTGTVTSVSVTTANGVSGSVATSTSTPAITITLGAITPTSVAASGTVTGSNLSGTNTGDNAANSLYSGLVSNATHTGDATGATALTLATVNSSVGSFGGTTAIPNFTVNAKGLITAAGTNAVVAPAGTLTGTVLNATVSQSSLQVVGNITSGTWSADIIAPTYLGTGTSITTKYLRGDGTWQTISGGGDALTSGNLSQFAATTSSQLAGVISDETGSGALVFATSPTLVTPVLGTPASGNFSSGSFTWPTFNQNTTGSAATLTTARTINGVSFNGSANITVAAAGSTLSDTVPVSKGGTGLTALGTGGQVLRTNAGATALEYFTLAGGGNAQTADPLSQFAATTSAQLAGVISDETGSGALVFGTSPTLTTPNLGTPSALTLTNATGLPIATGVSGLGTGIATALAVNTGSAGAPVLFNGALGTPSSGTISTGVVIPWEIQVACSDESTALTAGTAKVTFRMPWAATLSAVIATVTTAPTGSTLVVDINETGATILSTKLSIDATEKTSTTAATAAVISDTSLAADAEITIDIDSVGATIAGAGLKVTLKGTRTI